MSKENYKLNLDICKNKCKEIHSHGKNKFHGVFNLNMWDSEYGKRLKDAGWTLKIRCNKTQTDISSNSNIPDNCPFKLEHLMLNQK